MTGVAAQVQVAPDAVIWCYSRPTWSVWLSCCIRA